MKVSKISALILLASSITNAEVITSNLQLNKVCISIEPKLQELESDNVAKLLCFDSQLSESQINSEVEKYLNSKQIQKNDVVLATWTEIQL